MSLRSRMNGKTRRMRKLPSQKDFEKWWEKKAANANDNRTGLERAREDYEEAVMQDQANNYPDDFLQDYTDFQNAGGIKRLENAQKHMEKARFYSELANPAGKYNGKQRRTLRKMSANATKTAFKIDDAFDKKFGYGPSSSDASYEPTQAGGFAIDRDPRQLMHSNAKYSAYQNVRHKDPSWSYNHDVGPNYRQKNPYDSENEGEWIRMPSNPNFIRHDDSDNPVDDEQSDFNQEPEDYDDDDNDEGEE